MTDKVSICNMALFHCGVTQQIQNFDTDKSKEGTALRLFYDIALKTALEDFPWTFANKTVSLALSTINPTNEWGFRYKLPSDCVMDLRIPSGNRNDNQNTRVVYKVEGDSILTNMEDAQLEYTSYISNTGKFTPGFVKVFALRLALEVITGISGGDPFKMISTISGKLSMAITSAVANDKSKGQPDRPPESEFITVRGGVIDSDTWTNGDNQ